jgi:hypothetical protein
LLIDGARIELATARNVDYYLTGIIGVFRLARRGGDPTT